MTSEKQFVYNTASRIYASMFANPNVKEDMRYAIDRAIELYDELRKINLVDDDMSVAAGTTAQKQVPVDSEDVVDSELPFSGS